MSESEVKVGRFEDLADPGCREFAIGSGDWPFKGFVVRQGKAIVAYKNSCRHLGHPLNWAPDSFLTRDRQQIICSSHGAIFEIDSGECVGGPCLGKKLQRVACEVREGYVMVRGPTHA